MNPPLRPAIVSPIADLAELGTVFSYSWKFASFDFQTEPMPQKGAKGTKIMDKDRSE